MRTGASAPAIGARECALLGIRSKGLGKIRVTRFSFTHKEIYISPITFEGEARSSVRGNPQIILMPLDGTPSEFSSASAITLLRDGVG